MSTPKMIEHIHITHMTDPDLDQTATRLIPVFVPALDQKPLRMALEDLVEKATVYSEALKQQRISVYTEDIQALERNRDRALTELFHDVANDLLSTDPSAREAAHRVDVILRTYGNPAHRPMDTQTNVVNDIITALTDPSMAIPLNKLTVTRALVVKLLTLNNHFSELFNQRIAEHDHREKGIVRRTRKELETALRLAIDKINAYLLLFDAPELAGLAAAANAILEEAAHLINRRAGQRHRGEDAGGAAEPETVTAPGPAKPDCPCGQE